jgi:SOS-response transcriptional repressor LexA
MQRELKVEAGVIRELTKRQSELVDMIRSFTAEHGRSPSTRDMMSAFGFKSTNAIACMLNALEKKGAISRDKYKPRSVLLAGDAAHAARGDVLRMALQLPASDVAWLVQQLNETLGAQAPEEMRHAS